MAERSRQTGLKGGAGSGGREVVHRVQRSVHICICSLKKEKNRHTSTLFTAVGGLGLTLFVASRYHNAPLGHLEC